MIPNKKYIAIQRGFWAHVKLLSEILGYSARGTGKLKRYTSEDIIETMKKRNFSIKHLHARLINEQTYLEILIEYLNHRARILEDEIEPNLMSRDQAKEIFEKLKKELNPTCSLPMNKQKKEKKHYAYLTCIVNMLTEKLLGGYLFDGNPQRLTVITKNEKPIRTFVRRIDGAYPSINNPNALWEIKEYYGTKTFGSRVADGLYESILDGEELFELRTNEGIRIKHYLIVDDHFTWWIKGKSYLCRIIDMMHMGYVDEVLFGKEVLSRWPVIVKEWKKLK